MSVILDAMRGAVSKDKRRYQKNGYDLDVTPQIIAMGFPSESVEATYRNPMKEVLRFLDQYHKDHYKVYNLCSERSYDSQKFYNRGVYLLLCYWSSSSKSEYIFYLPMLRMSSHTLNKFRPHISKLAFADSSLVGLFPFDDHNAPPFELIATFCQNVQDWLDEDKLNIAVIHCKAGKGRTGLMICAWLLFTREWRTPQEALDFYAAMRTENKKGVTIPSQIRYVRYFHESLTLTTPFTLRPLLLHRVVFHTLPKTGSASAVDVNFTVHVGRTLVFTYKQFVEMNKLRDEPKVRRVADIKKRKKSKKDSKRDTATVPDDREDDVEDSGEWHQPRETAGLEGEISEDVAVFECGGVPVCGDVKIDFEKQGTRIFAFWFNTFFVKGLSLMITKEGLDKGNKDKHHKLYEEMFRVEGLFTELTENPRRFAKASSLVNVSPDAAILTSSVNDNNTQNSDTLDVTTLTD